MNLRDITKWNLLDTLEKLNWNYRKKTLTWKLDQ